MTKYVQSPKYDHDNPFGILHKTNIIEDALEYLEEKKINFKVTCNPNVQLTKAKDLKELLEK